MKVTIDQYTKRPPGTFAKFIKQSQAKEKAQQDALSKRILDSKGKSDRLMREAGFFKFNIPQTQTVLYPERGLLVTWKNADGILVPVFTKELITLEKLVKAVTNQAAYWTRRRVRRQLDCLEVEGGFVPLDAPIKS